MQGVKIDGGWVKSMQNITVYIFATSCESIIIKIKYFKIWFFIEIENYIYIHGTFCGCAEWIIYL